MSRKGWMTALAVVLSVFGVVILAAALAVWSIRPERLRAKAVQAISEHMGLQASLDSLSISLFPRPRLTGTGLVLALPNHPELPPFIKIDSFWVDVGLSLVIAKRVGTVHMAGLHITIPPGDTKKEVLKTPPSTSQSRIVIDRMETSDSELQILRRKPGARPLVFKIQHLVMDDLGFDRVVPFTATLTNPIPEGLVQSKGTIGPFPRGEPSALPVAGDYTFTGVDLATIKGIAGSLVSSGKYEGPLDDIDVTGTSSTPDFNLQLGGRPVPLSATFHLHVNGSDGTTRLDDVHAMLGQSELLVSGLVANLPGPGNHDIRLDVRMTKGRVEDILRLALDGPKTPIAGAMALHIDVHLPPAKTPVRDRLHITGSAQLTGATFTDPDTRTKLNDLSRRASGLGAGGASPDASTPTDLTTDFTLAGGVVTMHDVRFELPGAAVEIDGTYQMADGTIDFSGDLLMQASVSQAAGGGIKSALLKPFNFLFRRHDGVTSLPISISGTREHPKFGLRLFKQP